MTGQVYTVASGKGGVGKTTTAINLGAMFAEAGSDVVVVDTDLGMANIAGFLDFEMTGATLHDVLAGEANVPEAIYEAPGDIDVLPSSTDIQAFARSETEKLPDVVAQLRAEYDVVLLDTGAGISYDTMLPLSLADAVLLVTTPDVASVRDTAKSGELTHHVGGTVRGAVLTQRSNDILNAEDVEGTLETEILAVVPEDQTVPMGIDAGRPLAAFAPNAPAASAYRELAELLAGESARDGREAETAPSDAGKAVDPDGFDEDPVHDLIDERIVDAADESPTTSPFDDGNPADDGVSSADDRVAPERSEPGAEATDEPVSAPDDAVTGDSPDPRADDTTAPLADDSTDSTDSSTADDATDSSTADDATDSSTADDATVPSRDEATDDSFDADPFADDTDSLGDDPFEDDLADDSLVDAPADGPTDDPLADAAAADPLVDDPMKDPLADASTDDSLADVSTTDPPADAAGDGPSDEQVGESLTDPSAVEQDDEMPGGRPSVDPIRDDDAAGPGSAEPNADAAEPGPDATASDLDAIGTGESDDDASTSPDDARQPLDDTAKAPWETGGTDADAADGDDLETVPFESDDASSQTEFGTTNDDEDDDDDDGGLFGRIGSLFR